MQNDQEENPPGQLEKRPLVPEVRITAVQIVWQLLTYVLWSWALAALSILLAATLNYYVADRSGSSDYEFSLYAVAALICLVPFAFVADKFYAKNEPEQKHGFSAVIMVLSAVIVFLTTLGGFITAVLTALSILVNPGDTTTKVVVILTSLLVGLLGGILFIRILNPPKLRRFASKFGLVVVGIIAVSLVFASFGPFASEIAARDDKLLEEHLPTLNIAIQDYARANHRLPKSLEDLRHSAGYDADARLLVSRKLVEYKVTKDIDATNSLNELSKIFNDPLNKNASQNDGEYELCVTFKRAKGSPDTMDVTSEYNNTYISTYYHQAGRQCYTLQAYLY